ncbi:tyrosine-type recombinase/integrase [Stutzerimonas frequens]|uniref:tyrosine-type recombinase/integrase n=1 Tax=Stutzerimonas frequens TaxID=2968969 RepID=UPI00190E20BF|nr:tyrosine-type recombinase/integrase [Stutzerimonas frequens]MBK3872172.1 tyrosine-type recombinase/integrase [Stutzerimonas frequens]MBK3910703.1 tyrosine-type recombinase/integrase [Stutzerimonas frequens]MBK3929982.1 tyrosine-type recombinase/integrase [Stutzerimonas frequens]
MRPRKKDRHLPACMYQKHGAYYLVRNGKWERLGTDLQAVLMIYAKRMAAGKQGGMPDLIDRAFKHHCQHKKLSKNTVLQYEAAAERLKTIFAEFSPDQVLPKHVAAVKMDLAGTPNMCNRILSFLRIVFGYALEWQEVDSNPCIGITRHAEGRRDRYITDAEFGALLNAASPYIRSILEMCYLTGQRIGDVIAIRLADISNEGVSFVQEKTGAKLIVAMTPDLQAVIDQAKALPRKVRTLTLFCSRTGKPVAYETVKEAFQALREKTGIHDVKIHDIRAKSLTDADREGKNAQTLGGHTDARMTARYLRGRLPKIAQAPTMPSRIG